MKQNSSDNDLWEVLCLRVHLSSITFLSEKTDKQKVICFWTSKVTLTKQMNRRNSRQRQKYTEGEEINMSK
jgi:hypothetical protein